MIIRLLAALALFASLGGAAARAAAPAADELMIYNWNDYFGATTLADFTKATGIKVKYTTYSTNEEMEKRIGNGMSGFDIVVPSAQPYFARLAQNGRFKPLDKSKIPNLTNLDPILMQSVLSADPGNRYGIVYAWGTSGIAFNVDKIKQRMPNAPLHSWDMLFNPDIVKKFADCGVAVIDSGYEVFPVLMNYLGADPRSEKPEDLQAAEAAMLKLKPFIRKFDSANTIQDLADGRICLAFTWSGDALQAKAKADAARKGVHIDFNLPQEGSVMWFDMMGVLRDAPHPDAAFKFINFILDPDTMAKITNTVAYANAVPASLAKVDPAIKNDPDVFPTPEVRRHLFVVNQPSPAYEKLRQRAWEHISH